MLVINLFGGPGAGKTTTFLGTAWHLKMSGLKFEYVDEYAKAMVWEDRKNILRDQLYILAKQHRRLFRLQNKVDVVINEAPLINSLVYTPKNYFKTFAPLARELWNCYDNVNFLIERRFAYQSEGRVQSEVGAQKVDRSVEEMLKRENIPYIAIGADRSVECILSHLGLGSVHLARSIQSVRHHVRPGKPEQIKLLNAILKAGPSQELKNILAERQQQNRRI